MNLGSFAIDDLLTFYAQTQVFSTGVATDADSVPAYRIYEEETTTPLLTGSMALLDAANTAGLYSEQVTLSAANGFEKGKCYSIQIAATVSSVAGATLRVFQIGAAVDAKHIGGTTQTGRDIGASVLLSNGTGTGQVKLASGYIAPNWGDVGNPTTTVALSGTTVGTLTTYTGNTVQTGDSFARIGVAGAGLTAVGLTGTQTFSNTGTWTGNIVGTLSTLTTYTGNTPQTGDAFARLGVAGVGLTNLGDTRIANLDAAISTRMATFTLPTNFSALGINASGHVSRVVLVDTTTTNTDMRGTDNAAPAATALSTAVWTGTIAGRIDAAISSRMATFTLPTNFADLSIVASTGLVNITQAAADKAWSTTVRLLTAGTNIVLAKGTGITGFNDLSAAQVNSEADTALSDVGLTSVITGRIDVAVSSRSTFAGGAVASVTGAVGSVTGSVGSVTASVTVSGDPATAATRLLTMLSLVSGSTYQFTTQALALAPASGGGGTGLDGPSSVTLTFHDSSGAPIPLVEFTIVGQGFGRADNSGVASFGLDPGTYTVVSRATSYVLFEPATLTVTGSGALTIIGEYPAAPNPPSVYATSPRRRF